MLHWYEPIWADFLVNAALKSTVVLLAAWTVAKLMRRRSAAARHLVWTGAAAAVVALPFLTLGMPELRLPVNMPGITFHTGVTESADLAATAAAPGGSVVGTPSPHSATWHPDWPLDLMCLWAAGTLFLLGRMTFAIISVGRLRAKARQLERNGFEDVAFELGLGYSVPVLEGPAGSMPLTSGVWAPCVFMPADAREWPEERRRLVVLHELAHVMRGDVAAHLLARTSLCLYWWNPLAWLAWRESLKECEHATDDLVLRTGARASDYASHLLAVAQAMQPAAAIGSAAVAMARRSQLEGRLLAILDAGANRRAIGRATAIGAALTAMALVAPLAAIHAQNQNGAAARPQTRVASAQQAPHEPSVQPGDIRLRLDVPSAAPVQNETGETYGARLAKLGDAALKARQDANAIDLFTKAVSVLGNQSAAVHSLLSLGVLSMGQKDYAKAAEYFARVQSADPSRAGEALMWQGVTHEHETGGSALAESYYRSALALQGTSSPEATVTMDMLARLLKSTGRADEADQLAKNAAGIRQALGAKAAAQVVKSPEAAKFTPGSGMQAPIVLHKVEPEYSAEARAAKYQGTVAIYAEIGPEGRAHNIQVTRGLGLGLDEKAVEAISQWQFKPGMKYDQPITVSATIEVNFRLL
jgi:TonB family protein